LAFTHRLAFSGRLAFASGFPLAGRFAFTSGLRLSGRLSFTHRLSHRLTQLRRRFEPFLHGLVGDFFLARNLSRPFTCGPLGLGKVLGRFLQGLSSSDLLRAWCFPFAGFSFTGLAGCLFQLFSSFGDGVAGGLLILGELRDGFGDVPVLRSCCSRAARLAAARSSCRSTSF